MKVDYALPAEGYAKHITGVDDSHENGWAIAGTFLKASRGRVSADLPIGALVVVVDRAAHTMTLYIVGNPNPCAYASCWGDVAAAALQRGAPRVTVVPMPGGRSRRRGNNARAPAPAPPRVPVPAPFTPAPALTVAQEIALEDLLSLSLEERGVVIQLALEK